MDLTIVIVSWNTCDLLAQCLESIYNFPPACDFETWVIDNASSDGSVEMLKEDFPQVFVVENELNNGFAYANNQVLRKANSRFVLLLNSDTRVLESALEKMVAYMETHPAVGALGVKLINNDGSFQASYSKFPTLLSEFLLVTGLAQIFFGPYAPSPRPRIGEVARQVDWVSGAVMLLRKETIQQAGLLCEKYFFYSEDTDWCFRIWKSGWSIWYLPEISVIHLQGGSSRKSSLASYAQLYLNKILFFELNYGKTQAVLLQFMFRVVFSVRYAAWKIFDLLYLQNLFGLSIQQHLIQDHYVLSLLNHRKSN